MGLVVLDACLLADLYSSGMFEQCEGAEGANPP